MKFAFSMGFSAMADRMLCPSSCTYSRVVGLRF